LDIVNQIFKLLALHMQENTWWIVIIKWRWSADWWQNIND